MLSLAMQNGYVILPLLSHKTLVMPRSAPLIYLFQYDLRLADNPALSAAVKTGQPIIPCYILDEQSPGFRKHGGASLWWFHHSLSSLKASLKEKNGRLLLRRGALLEEVLCLVEETGASAVYWSRFYLPAAAKIEQAMHEKLTKAGVEAKRFSGYLLFEPEQIKNGSGEAFKVFTPFWKACLRGAELKPALPIPAKISFSKQRLQSDKLEQWQLLPKEPNWAVGFREQWQPGEAGARRCLNRFLKKGIVGYKVGRDVPSQPSTSKLSPHLHFGEISPRIIWHKVHAELALSGGLQKDAEHFLSEIGWREFAYHLLHHWPRLPSKPFRPNFVDFPWRKNKKALQSWQRGNTGIPLIDAGMRELWSTGWMHNRVRMIVASFLTKNLLIHWREGEAWFWDTLVDADLANNVAGWQWVAGSGADAAPYFRIFNPVTQSEKFDPEALYIKRWVPELKKLTAAYCHKPWEAPEEALAKAGIVLGETYPYPLVDLKLSREQALEAYQRLRVK